MGTILQHELSYRLVACHERSMTVTSQACDCSFLFSFLLLLLSGVKCMCFVTMEKLPQNWLISLSRASLAVLNCGHGH